MKKILVTLIALLFLPFSLVWAMTASPIEEWHIIYHLKYRNGTLTSDTSSGLAYTPIMYTPESLGQSDPKDSDFYATTLSGSGTEIERFGFNIPTVYSPALGESLFDVTGKYFAYADRIVFFKKGGVELFRISLKGSSFCNEDTVCNADAGEDHMNCPMDCPAPQPTTQTEQDPTTKNVTPATPNTGTPNAPIDVSVTQGGENGSSTPLLTPTRTTLIVASLIVLILFGILWKLKRFRDEE
jgi:hypothetical protein